MSPHRISGLPSLRTELVVGALGALFLSLLITITRGVTSPLGIFRGLMVGMTYALVMGPMMFAVLPRVRRAIDPLSALATWTIMLACGALISAVGTLVVQALFVGFGWAQWSSYWANYGLGVRVAMLIGIGGTIAAELFSTLHARLEDAQLGLVEQSRQKEQALRTATEARLASLESRLRPHFLFNSLNSATQLTAVDPERAADMLQRLAGLLRFSLDAHESGLVSFARELQVTRDYLEIERSRFGDRLRCRFEVDEGLDELGIPPLAIQTLVENSVKYAVAPRVSGGEIAIRATRDDAAFHIEVVDDGPGLSSSELPAGHGLDNLRSRLSVLFGDEAELLLDRASPGGRVQLRLPVERKSEAA